MPTNAEPALRVLLVEDNHADARLLHEYLREPSFPKCELTRVETVAQAIATSRGGEFDAVRTDILSVLQPTHARGQKLKVIFENCYLNDAQKIKLCEICGELGHPGAALGQLQRGAALR